VASRTAVVIASFLIGLGAVARESFAQYYPPQAYPRPRIIHLRDLRRFRQLRPTMITICRLAVDHPTPAQPVPVKSIPWRPD
jgi:hypothetical protein